MGKYKQIGKKGEILAYEYLKVRKYSILEQNYKYEKKEIDLIATKNGLLIFIEVKTRSHHLFGYPEEAVDETKQASIKEVALQYQLDHPQYLEVRFDIISITLPKNKAPEILHIKDAFY